MEPPGTRTRSSTRWSRTTSLLVRRPYPPGFRRVVDPTVDRAATHSPRTLLPPEAPEPRGSEEWRAPGDGRPAVPARRWRIVRCGQLDDASLGYRTRAVAIEHGPACGDHEPPGGASASSAGRSIVAPESGPPTNCARHSSRSPSLLLLVVAIWSLLVGARRRLRRVLSLQCRVDRRPKGRRSTTGPASSKVAPSAPRAGALPPEAAPGQMC